MRACALLLLAAVLPAAGGWREDLADWRRKRESDLRSERGWLALAGLVWLREGANTFGSAPDVAIVVPDPAVAARAGVVELRDGRIFARTDGQSRELRPDSADVFPAGRVELAAIRRGERYGIRLRDPESPLRREFKGLRWFPAVASYRVPARFVAEARKVPILNVLGQTEQRESPGYVEFALDGRSLRLRPVLESPDARELFFIFRDRTSGKETYGAGRFLYTELPRDGYVLLDFNRAYNPPCAYSPFTTCPLPPKENRLPVRIAAGEQAYPRD